MLDHFSGSVILEFIGAFTRWCLHSAVNKFKGKEVKSFSEIWEGKESNDNDAFFYGLSNTLLGLIVLITLIGVGFAIDAIWY